MSRFFYTLILITGGLIVLTGSWSFRHAGQGPVADSLEIRKQFSSSPVLSPRQSVRKMELEPGFAVKIVAAEPLVNTPVALSFDRKGRIWVVEMEGYMPDTVGTGEEAPNGRIVILSDKNKDGIMDDRKIFLDSLVLPRALCLIENGILVAESPRLWYYEIRDDKPVKKTLVDSAYAEGGNVEHQPNGLLRALDNWIYNAKSDKRYRKQGERWLIEKTHFRGQWGISQDNAGRLFYNTNSENLIGDLFSPALGASNPNQKSVSGFNKRMVSSNKVYPARATTGVNRAYMPGILDDSLRLVNFTAACGPVIYNGALFAPEYEGNAFVAEPSANLIKRNILPNDGYMINGRQAYSGREFLRSTDERFRPVNLYNGPDGALYIVDMYRGIIQHKTYLTPYLKNEIRERSLTQPLSYGRIYKVVPVKAKPKNVILPDDPVQLVRFLANRNGWVRSMAQQTIVDAGDLHIVPALRELLKNPSEPLPLIHALWTLEGLGALQKEDVLPLLKLPEWDLRMQALAVSHSVINKENYRDFVQAFNNLIDDEQAAPYIAFLAGDIQPADPFSYRRLVEDLVKKYADNTYVSDALISTMKDQEDSFLKRFLAIHPDTGLILNKRISKVVEDIQKAKSAKADPAKEYPAGAAIFRSLCQTCHGADGNGVVSLAPPLNNSEWVTGDKNRLASIVLYGLTGPVRIGNKVYKKPEINGEMPGIVSNDEFSDEAIAQLLSYIRNSWNNQAARVTKEEVSEIRTRFKGRQKPFTAEEF